ncbi:epimerase [Paenarthrobacter sp. DKR-5]|uniref:epimerase n=1 Tax=Paenarthrobacter sp. DKR-5 TaxID=2835535 RepID=UPI001BDD05F2|nr:epimerase [Paenarthrobacter sp. DKR-5]MBT1003810.1 epimerase [Paenarthrobacter sp. DKR-5]
MRILILGGTVFLSAHTAREAVQRGHEVTCLARGVSGRVPEGATLVAADRSDGTRAYDGLDGDWDAVVDVSWQPGHVREALKVLAPRARHWTYVSSCSVYADHAVPGLGEEAVLLPHHSGAEAGPGDYGEAKVACEQLSVEAVGSRLHISRPGLIGGPGDGSDRFGYWPARFARSSEPAVVPDTPETLVQVIDVRDLAAWLIDAAEEGVTGPFNAVGRPTELRTVLGAAMEASGFEGTAVPAPADWLQAQGVRPWAGEESLPLWLPSGYEGFGSRSAAAALEQGLTLRPLEETVEAALAYERELGLDRPRKAGLSAARERELVSLLRAATRP